MIAHWNAKSDGSEIGPLSAFDAGLLIPFPAVRVKVRKPIPPNLALIVLQLITEVATLALARRVPLPTLVIDLLADAALVEMPPRRAFGALAV